MEPNPVFRIIDEQMEQLSKMPNELSNGKGANASGSKGGGTDNNNNSFSN